MLAGRLIDMNCSHKHTSNEKLKTSNKHEVQCTFKTSSALNKEKISSNSINHGLSDKIL